jgi:hypothetical protein
MITRPQPSEHAPYFARYISLVPDDDILRVLGLQTGELERLFRSLTPERELYRYAPGKWTIREVVGHLIDAERVFGYRAFCISRGERVSLPAFDENAYVAESRYDSRSLSSLLAEFALTRNSNLAFLSPLTDAEWMRLGSASDNPVSVRALAWMMAGHVRHHDRILRENYGVNSVLKS